MILWYIRYIIVSNNWGRMWGGVDTIWSMLKWYLTMTIVMYQVTSATCCKDHIPRWKDKSSYWRKLIWSIRKRYATMKNHVSFHTSHVLYRPYKKKEKEKWENFFKGGDPLTWFCENHYSHMVLTAKQQVQWPFDWNFICSKTAGICGINLWSTTVVCWLVHSQMGDPSE